MMMAAMMATTPAAEAIMAILAVFESAFQWALMPCGALIPWIVGDDFSLFLLQLVTILPGLVGADLR